MRWSLLLFGEGREKRSLAAIDGYIITGDVCRSGESGSSISCTRPINHVQIEISDERHSARIQHSQAALP